jgi:hypothetical protein
MTAADYRQLSRSENSLGLHYSPFCKPNPFASTTYKPKIPKTKVESAKIG